MRPETRRATRAGHLRLVVDNRRPPTPQQQTAVTWAWIGFLVGFTAGLGAGLGLMFFAGGSRG